LLAAACLGAVALPASADHSSARADAFARWFSRNGLRDAYRHGGHSGSHCDPGARTWTRYGNDCDTCASRCFDPCGRVYGTSWSTMRRYLAPNAIRSGHRHYRSWWIRRWPVRASGYGSWLCKGPEAEESDCAFAKAAAGDDAAPASTDDRLVRGLERWRQGRFDAASEDFRAVLAANPAEGRAGYGRLMCAFAAKDWPECARSLGDLSAIGELDARDRLDDQEGADSPVDFAALASGLESWTRHSFTDADAQLVCGWVLAATGRADAARAHLRASLRWKPGDAAATKLVADLEGASERATPVAPAPVETSPRPALEREGPVAVAER
jgi:tetratricopeptide (TPR) repeat protein